MLVACSGAPRPAPPAASGPLPFEVRAGGASVRSTDPHVVSITNTNDHFIVWMRLDPLPPGAQPVLRVGALELPGLGAFDDNTQLVNATFSADREQALRVARALGVQIAERVPLDGGLTYAWRVAGAPAVGEGVTLALRIENHGPRTVHLKLGGQQRGPRDNSFSFRARFAGAPLPVKEVLDFGGLAHTEPLAPGAHLEVQADLRGWVDLERPGTYEVDCAYHGELYSDGGGYGQWPEHAHEAWGLEATGSVLVTLR